MPSSPASTALDWSVIAALITAGVTGLISIYNLLAVLEMRAARRVSSEALLEVLGIGNQLTIFIDTQGSSPILNIEQGPALLFLINLSKGPAYDIRLDLEVPAGRVNEDISRQFGDINLVISGRTISIEGLTSSRTFPVLHRMALRLPAILGDATSRTDFALTEPIVLAIISAYIRKEYGRAHATDTFLGIPLTIRYRDILRHQIAKQKTVTLRLISTIQSTNSLKLTFEVGDVYDS